MPGWLRRKSFYQKELLEDGKHHYPYDPAPGERPYENWKKKVINPATNEYYTTRNKIIDENEQEKEIEEGVKHLVNQIIRLRTAKGDEKLLTMGTLIGYDAIGNIETVNCATPELYEETRFIHKRVQKDNHMIIIPDGVQEIVKHYTLPFNEKNVDTLLEKKNPKGCQLSLMDEKGGSPKECKNIEWFKTKPFDYIFNDEFLTPQERENAIKEHQVLQGEILATNQKKAGR